MQPRNEARGRVHVNDVQDEQWIGKTNRANLLTNNLLTNLCFSSYSFFRRFLSSCSCSTNKLANITNHRSTPGHNGQRLDRAPASMTSRSLLTTLQQRCTTGARRCPVKVQPCCKLGCPNVTRCCPTLPKWLPTLFNVVKTRASSLNLRTFRTSCHTSSSLPTTLQQCAAKAARRCPAMVQPCCKLGNAAQRCSTLPVLITMEKSLEKWALHASKHTCVRDCCLARDR